MTLDCTLQAADVDVIENVWGRGGGGGSEEGPFPPASAEWIDGRLVVGGRG